MLSEIYWRLVQFFIPNPKTHIVTSGSFIKFTSPEQRTPIFHYGQKTNYKDNKDNREQYGDRFIHFTTIKKLINFIRLTIFMIPQKSMDEIVGRAAGNRTRSTCTPCMCTAGILQPAPFTLAHKKRSRNSFSRRTLFFAQNTALLATRMNGCKK